MLHRYIPLVVLAFCACSHTVPQATPAAAEPAAATAAAASAPSPARQDPPKSAAAYSGLGVDSLPPGTLEKFAPKPAPSAITGHVQQVVELLGPGAGMLTPDGKRLIFSWRVSGQQQLWRSDGPRQFPVQLTSGEDRTTIEAITPDSKTLVLSRDKNGEENPGIYVMSVDGGAITALQHIKGVQTRFHTLSRDGKWLYITANDQTKDSYTVYRFNLATKAKETLYNGPGLWSVSDVRNDGSLLLRKALGSLPSEFYELAAGASEVKPLFGQGEGVEYEASYGPRAGELIVMTPKIGEFRRLYVWKGGKLEPLSPEMKHDVSSFSIDENKSRLVYTINDDGFSRIGTMVWKAGTWVSEPTTFLPKADSIGIGSLSRDGRRATAMVDYGDRPPTTLVVDFSGHKTETWVNQSLPEIDASSFVHATLESYPARDGTPIPVFVRRPKQCATAACPVIVEFHGGPEGQYLGGFNGTAQLFVDAGFVHIAPNVRGSDGYGKTWIAADDGAKRLQIITDIEDAAIWARKTFAAGGVTPKVGVYGGSYGGYSVLVGMTMFAGAYDAGVSVVGIANFLTFLNNTAPYRRILRISEYGDPEKDKAVLEKLSPTSYIDQVKAPLMLLQGATDPRVPVGEAIAMYDAVSKKGVPTELMIFADEGHGASKRSNRVIMLSNAVRFFEQYLK